MQSNEKAELNNQSALTLGTQKNKIKLSRQVVFPKVNFYTKLLNLQSKYKKCPASTSVVCCDLLYFIVFFGIRYRLNAIKYIFRTFYH